MGYVLCCSVGILHNVVLAFRGESSLGTTAQTYIKEEYDKVFFFFFFLGGGLWVEGLGVYGFRADSGLPRHPPLPDPVALSETRLQRHQGKV